MTKVKSTTRHIHIHAADIKTSENRTVPYIVTAQWNGKRLSMQGVEGPKSNGNAYGDCGQARSNECHMNKAPFYARLMEVWERWHLNDTRTEDVPQDVVEWIFSLPQTNLLPARWLPAGYLGNINGLGCDPDVL